MISSWVIQSLRKYGELKGPRRSGDLLGLEFSTLGRSCRSFRRRRCPFEIALFIRACDHRSSFQVLFDQILTAAAWTFLRNRLVRRGELALGVIPAPIKCVALACALLD